ncbi:MAG TPA: hypothetical protein VEL76_16485 [Gemmataceae bacterium]|nr:hypothetical protein [Gemmataceae bacterium]
MRIAIATPTRRDAPNVRPVDVTEDEARALLMSIKPLAKQQEQIHERLLALAPLVLEELQAAEGKAALATLQEQEKEGVETVPEQFLVLVTCCEERHQVELLEKFCCAGLDGKPLLSCPWAGSRIAHRDALPNDRSKRSGGEKRTFARRQGRWLLATSTKGLPLCDVLWRPGAQAVTESGPAKRATVGPQPDQVVPASALDAEPRLQFGVAEAQFLAQLFLGAVCPEHLLDGGRVVASRGFHPDHPPTSALRVG